MSVEPYGYVAWICSNCSGHLIEDNTNLLLCETCGYSFEQVNQDHARLVPDEEDEGD
jgi:DNA-directed RNA polymerase subunit M/transcription elongation factor TFIIS